MALVGFDWHLAGVSDLEQPPAVAIALGRDRTYIVIVTAWPSAEAAVSLAR